MSVNYSKLRKLAEEATEGPWCWEQCGDKCSCNVVGVTEPPMEGLFSEEDYYDDETDTYDPDRPMRIENVACLEDSGNDNANAAFIAAANPTCVLELLNKIEELEEWIKDIRQETLERDLC